MLIEMWPIARVRPYERNPRKIPQAAVDKVAESIRLYGWQQPIVVDGAGVILVGHVRRLAALKLKLEEVPVHVARNLTPEQALAYRLADNRSHDEAKWDMGILALEVSEIAALDPNAFTAFDPAELEALNRSGAQPGEDELPPAAAPVTRPDDLWILGDHRLLCGDATAPEAVARLHAAGGEVPRLMVTDPPYGVQYEPSWRLKKDVDKPWQKLAHGTVPNDGRADWSAAYDLFLGSVAYVWHSGMRAGEVVASLERSRFEVRAQIIWVKTSMVISRGHYHWQHDPCWYAVRKGASATWKGDRKQSTVWQVASMHATQGQVDDGKNEHSTQKPVELMRRPILNHTERGSSVYDPFLGSGTTLIACELEGRKCYGIEIEPAYCDLIVRRWQKLTGRQATLAGHGATYEHVLAGRQIEGQDAIAEEALS